MSRIKAKDLAALRQIQAVNLVVERIEAGVEPSEQVLVLGKATLANIAAEAISALAKRLGDE